MALIFFYHRLVLLVPELSINAIICHVVSWPESLFGCFKKNVVLEQTL